jgi:hypothetical protein
MGALICFAGEISKWWTSVDVEMACFANHPALTRNDFPNPDYRKNHLRHWRTLQRRTKDGKQGEDA